MHANLENFQKFLDLDIFQLSWTCVYFEFGLNHFQIILKLENFIWNSTLKIFRPNLNLLDAGVGERHKQWYNPGPHLYIGTLWAQVSKFIFLFWIFILKLVGCFAEERHKQWIIPGPHLCDSIPSQIFWLSLTEDELI